MGQNYVTVTLCVAFVVALFSRLYDFAPRTIVYRPTSTTSRPTFIRIIDLLQGLLHVDCVS